MTVALDWKKKTSVVVKLIFLNGMVSSSFKQYSILKTGVGSLPSLGKIKLRQSIRGFLLSTYGTFRCNDVVEYISSWWFLFYFYFDTIKHQHHSSLSAINTLLLSVSFKPIFIDFAHILNMLALSMVFIFFIVCGVCVSFVVCLCVFRFAINRVWYARSLPGTNANYRVLCQVQCRFLCRVQCLCRVLCRVKCLCQVKCRVQNLRARMPRNRGQWAKSWFFQEEIIGFCPSTSISQHSRALFFIKTWQA